MERIMKAQTLNDTNSMNYMMAKKSLEINPSHPIITRIKETIHLEEELPRLKGLISLLYDTALLTSGFNLDEPKVFSSKINNMIMMGLGIEPNMVSEEDQSMETEEDQSMVSEENQSVGKEDQSVGKEDWGGLDTSMGDDDMENVD